MNSQRLFNSFLVVLIVALGFSGIADDRSQAIAEQSLTRALVTFAAARTLNGVISAAQGTEVALEPGGVGLVLSVGEALDPINDLIERFSGVMLVAASSLGLQNILLGISRWWGMNAALAATALATLIAMWTPKLAGTRLEAIATRMLLMAVFLRFAIPVLIIMTNLVSAAFLDDELAQATSSLEATSTEIEALGEVETEVPAADDSLMDRLGAMLDNSLDSLNASERLDRLREAASNVAEDVINLIVIFVLQTILLPLGIFWLLLEIVKGYIARISQRSG